MGTSKDHAQTRACSVRDSASRLLAYAALIAFITGCSPHEVEVKVFEDITPLSGLANHEGMTHGAAWGDYDGDGLPDLYVTNHLKPAALFRNLGGGRFADVTGQLFAPDGLGGDKHGAAWADFNNDGRPDLAQLTGALQGVGEEPKRLFVNAGGAPFKRFRCVTPMWDNSARRKVDARIVIDSTPELYESWLRAIAAKTSTQFDHDERLVFINAWNEWAEGNHLEPDLKWGRGYLEATKRALEAAQNDSRKPATVITPPEPSAFTSLKNLYWRFRAFVSDQRELVRHLFRS